LSRERSEELVPEGHVAVVRFRGRSPQPLREERRGCKTPGPNISTARHAASDSPAAENFALRRHALKVEQAKQLAAILLDAGPSMDEIRPNPRARANDPKRLPGLTVVGRRGSKGGAIRGTRPHVDGPSPHRAATAYRVLQASGDVSNAAEPRLRRERRAQ
jgi:hypothetical protein